MPKVNFFLIQCEGADAVATLKEALAAAFPAGVPTGPGVATAEVDEPTEIEPANEPTDLEPVKSEPPKTTPLKRLPASGAVVAKPRRGKIEEGRVRAVEYLRQHGASTRSELARQCGIAHGSIGLAFNDDRFTSNEKGLLTLSHHAAKSQGTIGSGLVIDRGAIGYARDAVYAELALHDEPRTLRQIVRDTHLREGLVVEALKHKSIRETAQGFEIVPRK